MTSAPVPPGCLCELVRVCLPGPAWLVWLRNAAPGPGLQRAPSLLVTYCHHISAPLSLIGHLTLVLVSDWSSSTSHCLLLL